MTSLASFNVHLSAGLAASGVAATALMVAGLGSEADVLRWFLLGTAGSLLPDLDADNSAPVQVAFSVASVLLAFLCMFSLAGVFPTVAELVLVWLTAYLAFRWVIFALFTRFTTHRGIFHSMPAAAFFGLLSAALAHRVFGQSAYQAWMNGVFVCFGYLLHLLLDELHSVNVFGLRTRRSLGTALKLYSRNSPPATLYMYVVTIALLAITPDVTPLVRVAADAASYRQVQDHLLPPGIWFGHRHGESVPLAGNRISGPD